MGSSAVHYVVLGVVLRQEDKVKDFFRLTEDQYEILDEYYDNPYDKEVTPTKSGIHIISDGMSSEYVIVGKILQKTFESQGLSLMSLPIGALANDMQEEYKEIYPSVLELDKRLGTKFGGMQAEFIVLTHWH